jgi:hypothetical protein
LSFSDDKDGERPRKVSNSPDGGEPPHDGRPARKRRPAPELGHALRSAYERTLEEDIPPEMLDLLGKLG